MSTHKKEEPSCILIFLAELFGTIILIFIGCLGCVQDQYDFPQTIIIPAFSWGLAIVASATIFGPISGCHVNPAVTLGLTVLNKCSPKRAVVYFLGQYVGSFIGYGILHIIIPTFTIEKSHHPNGVCTLGLAPNLSVLNGFIFEFVGTMILMFVVCASTDERNSSIQDSGPLKIGLSVAGIIFALGPFSGAGINPARAISPSTFNNFWKNHWIYHVGPFLGALLSAVFYKFVFSEDDQLFQKKQTMHVSKI